jgi:hypothetical protein
MNMSPRRRRPLAKAAVSVLVACGALLAIPSFASASTVSGTEHFRIVSTSTAENAPSSIVARGVFTAGGTDFPGNNKDLAVFADGAFTIHHPEADSTFSDNLNSKTCVDHVTGSGTYTLGQGYGAYAKIKGSGTYDFRGVFTLPRNPNGTCNTSSSAQPTASQTVITANGPVSF